jgi:hypothetical protein
MMMVKKLRPDTSATYRICVQGILDEGWSDRLGGMTINATGQTSESPITTLRGRMLDQSGLLGVLNTLHDLRLPLLLVECEDCDGELPQHKVSN